jgi:hypothetical protein
MNDFTIDEGDPTAPQGKETAKRNRRDERALLLAGIEFWVTDDGTPHASVPHPKGHMEHMRIASREFANHLRVKNLQAHGAGLAGTALGDLVADAEAKALVSGEVRMAWRRFALHRGEIFVDLGGRDPGGERRAVAVSQEGWRIMPAKDVPVSFLRGADAQPLPEPELASASWGDLARVMNAEGDELVLIWAWLICAARPFEGPGQYPAMLLHGEQGSGKSKAGAFLQALIDPSRLTGRTMPKDPADIWISANARHLVAFDNLSAISGDFADQIAPLATHGSYTKKKLYTDGDEWTVTACRPMCFIGIPSGLLNRPDLADRAIAIELRPFPEGREDDGGRKRDDALFSEFAALRPALLGLLFDGLAAGLRNLPDTKLPYGPRLLDSATWAEACAPGLGIEPGTILNAWMANRSQAAEAALEADDVAQAVVRLVDVTTDPHCEGSASEMLERLRDMNFELSKAPHWPRNAQAMGTKLRRIAPGLRAIYGIDATQSKKGAEGRRFWFLKKRPEYDLKKQKRDAR